MLKHNKLFCEAQCCALTDNQSYYSITNYLK